MTASDGEETSDKTRVLSVTIPRRTDQPWSGGYNEGTWLGSLEPQQPGNSWVSLGLFRQALCQMERLFYLTQCPPHLFPLSRQPWEGYASSVWVLFLSCRRCAREVLGIHLRSLATANRDGMYSRSQLDVVTCIKSKWRTGSTASGLLDT
jgi:hypothetical protein